VLERGIGRPQMYFLVAVPPGQRRVVLQHKLGADLVTAGRQDQSASFLSRADRPRRLPPFRKHIRTIVRKLIGKSVEAE
jgi:hypothetical protein